MRILLGHYSKTYIFYPQISSNGAELKIMTSDQKIVKVSLGEPVGFMIWCENRSSQLVEATYQSFFLTTYFLLITAF